MKHKKVLSAVAAAALALTMGATGCTVPVSSGAAPGATGAEATANAGDGATTQPAAVNDSADNPAKGRAGAADTLIVGGQDTSNLFMPIYYSSRFDRWITDLAFSRLYSNDEEGNITYNDDSLATGCDFSDDHKTLTFHLKDGVKFSNGDPLTAEDVKFTYQLVACPAYQTGEDGGRYIDAMTNVVGFEDYRDGKTEELAGIKVIDPLTISFEFKEARVDNILNFYDVQIMSKNYYGVGVTKDNIKPIMDKMKNFDFMGSGRYIIKHIEPKQYVEMEVNPNYFGGAAKIKNLIYKTVTPETMFEELKSGGVDILLRVPANADDEARLNEMPFVTTTKYIENSYAYIGLNTADQRLSDVKVRQALTYGFNRQGFMDLYFSGNGVVFGIPFSPASWAYTDAVKPYPFDPAKANQLLDEAGWTEKDADGIRMKDGQKLDFTWDTYTDSKYVETMIPLLTADWKNIGVKVTPNLMDFSALADKVYEQQDFQMYNMSWALDIDPASIYTNFGSQATVKSGNNSVQYKNPELDKLMLDGMREFDQAKRKEIYTKVAEILNRDCPYVFIGTPQNWDSCNTRVKNFNPSPYRDWTYDIRLMELEP